MNNFLKKTTNRLFSIIGKYGNRIEDVLTHRNFNRLLKITLYVIIIFLRLPPIYVLPIQSAFFNSHSIARYFILFILTILIINISFKRESLKLTKLLAIFILFFFFSQSISILAAVNISEFFLLYKHILFSLLLFIVIIYIVKSEKDIHNVLSLLLYTTVVNIFLESALYYLPEVRPYLRSIIYDKEWDVIDVNLMRNRYFVTIYDAALIPLYFYLVYTSKNILNKLLYILITCLVTYFTYISNFRTHFIMSLLGLFSSMYIYLRKKKRYLATTLITIYFLLNLLTIFASSLPISSLDRIIEPEDKDYSTLSIRLDWWKQSIEIAKYSPLIGVGLRNYYDYTDHAIGKSLFAWKDKLQKITLAHPHNIFFGTLAETGLIGLISLILLLSYFLVSDLKEFKKQRYLSQSVIASFWILFSYSLLNPPDTLTYLALFWLLRGLIYKVSIL